MKRSSKQLLTFILFSIPIVASAFPIEVDSQLAGLPVSVSTSSMADNLLVVHINNYGPETVDCSARMKGGPEVPRVRKVQVAGMQQGSVTASFNNKVIRARVQVNCQLSDSKGT